MGRGTYTAGTVDSVLLLKVARTKRHQIDLPHLNIELYFCCSVGRQKCTKLHRLGPIFSKNLWSDTPGPHNWEQGKPPPQTPSASVHRPAFFRASAAATVSDYET